MSEKENKTNNDKKDVNVTLKSDQKYSEPTVTSERKPNPYKISDLAASKIRLMFRERDAITLEYSKKIDLFLFGILEGQGIDRSKIVDIDFENMEVFIDNTPDN